MKGKVGGDAAALLMVGVGVRAWLWLSYEPVYFADSPHYEDFARALLALDWSSISGIRTPGYPLLLLLGGLNWQLVWLWQSLLGLGSSLLLYDLTRRAVGDSWPALVAGLIPTLQFNLLFAEANILTESLATFWLLMTIWLCQRAETQSWSAGRSLAIGIVATAAGLTRPLLLLLLPALCVWYFWGHFRRVRLRPVVFLALLAPFILGLGGWTLFIWLNHGYPGPTTLTGYNLLRHAGAYFEHLPAEYEPLKEVFLQYRAAAVADGGDHTIAVWQAREAMMAATGLDYADLSRELTIASLWLFWHRPVDYLQGVFEAWTWFWRKSNLWQLRLIRPVPVQPVLAILWWSQVRILLALDVLFWFFAGTYWWRWLRRRPFGPRLPVFVSGFILLTSLAQAFLEYGENARYAAPYQPLIWYVVLVAAWPWLRQLSQTEDA